MPVPDSLSRIVEREGSAPYAFVAEANRTLTVGEFAADIAACADSLPSCRFAINVCTNRYRFAVAFFAAITRGQINLLPSRRDAATLDALRRDYQDSAILSDKPADEPTDQPHARSNVAVDLTPGGHGTAAIPQVDHAQVAAIVFTSGSTGAPRPHAKTWGLLDHFRSVHWRYLQRSLGSAPHQIGLVATVPPWHMYGLEWALLLPTVAPVTVHCGADFFPRDVTAALSGFDDLPTILVATPTHLRALLTSAIPTKPVAATLSATAPLNDDLASQMQAYAGGRLVEIYGASEIGSLAIRHPLDEDAAWRFFDCFDVAFDAGRVTVTTHHLPEPVTLQDRFEQAPQGFVLRGRATDVVKVGGKRESLANLNAVLLAIPGVEDGFIYDPERLGLPATGRLGAVAVAPRLNARYIRTQLARSVDAAFVPRSIRLVPALPRGATSKLALRDLRQLLADATAERDE